MDIKKEGILNNKHYKKIRRLIYENKLIYKRNKYIANKEYILDTDGDFLKILDITASLLETKDINFILDLVGYINDNIKNEDIEFQEYLLKLTVYYLRYSEITKEILSDIKNINDVFFKLFKENVLYSTTEDLYKDYIRNILMTYKDITSLTGKQLRKIVDDKLFEKVLKILLDLAENKDKEIYLRQKELIRILYDIVIMKYTNNDKILKLIKKIKENEKEYILLDINKKELIRIEHYKNRKEEIINNIKKKFIGREEIIENIFRSLNKSIYKMNKRPTTLLFTGESGTGKTAIAIEIAKVFGGKPLIYNLGNFFSDHTLSTLLGSPPGYTGFSEKTLIEKYIYKMEDKNKDKHNKDLPIIPIIVFDELEKANSTIQNAFLEMFDIGTLTLLNGVVLDISNAIIILTSNIGMKETNKIGFDNEEENKKKNIDYDDIKLKLTKYLRVEIVNRIDDIFYFDKNTDEEIEKIKELKINEIIDGIIDNFFFKSLFSQKISKTQIKKKVIAKLKKSNFELDNIRLLEKEIENIIVETYF